MTEAKSTPVVALNALKERRSQRPDLIDDRRQTALTAIAGIDDGEVGQF